MKNSLHAAVRSERNGAVTTVVLARPGLRNAIDRTMAAALSEAFLEFERDSAAHVAILWGEGGTFCAGADLKAIAEGKGNRVSNPCETWNKLATDAPLGPTRMRLSKPVIAAIAGHAVAGGLELALWCDLRVAEQNAVFGVFNRPWGVPLMDGGTVRLPRLIGLSRAMDLVLTGRPIAASEALQFGLVNRVVPNGTARSAAEEIAQGLAAHPQATLRNDRLSLYQQEDHDFAGAMAGEFALARASLGSGEAKEGASRFAGWPRNHGK